jgi:hypothetical protein
MWAKTHAAARDWHTPTHRTGEDRAHTAGEMKCASVNITSFFFCSSIIVVVCAMAAAAPVRLSLNFHLKSIDGGWYDYLVQCNEGDNLLEVATQSAARHPHPKVRALQGLHVWIDGKLSDMDVCVLRTDAAKHLTVAPYCIPEDDDDDDE